VLLERGFFFMAGARAYIDLGLLARLLKDWGTAFGNFLNHSIVGGRPLGQPPKRHMV